MSDCIAQINVARLIADAGDPRVAPFIEAIDRINAIAERSEGFIWRHRGDDLIEAPDDPRLIVNLSLWRDLGSLRRFAMNTVHARFMERRDEWFSPYTRNGRPAPSLAMWRAAPQDRPSVAEGFRRLALRAENGDGAEAFGWEGPPAGGRSPAFRP